MLLTERWNRILDAMDARGETSVEELAQLLGRSPATIRRDLNQLDQKGLLRRTHGGAAPVRRVAVGRTIAESRKSHPREKEAIGLAAAALVEPGETLFIDGGYTTYQAARHLEGKRLTVVTNSIDVAQALTPLEDVKVILLGGEVNRAAGASFGAEAVNRVSQMIADRAILGADAFSAEEGLSTPILNVSELKGAMVKRARHVMVLADHSKLGRFAVYQAAPIDEIHTLVTDAEADAAALDAIHKSGVQVVVAPGKGRAAHE